jgi:hypothetical protein
MWLSRFEPLGGDRRWLNRQQFNCEGRERNVSNYPQPQGWPPNPPGPGVPPYGYGYQPQQPTKNNGFAIASIILGVVGCVASLVGFGLFTIPVVAVGLALGIVAFKGARNESRSAKVMAIVGIALSVLALVLTVAWIVILINGLIDSGEIP